MAKFERKRWVSTEQLNDANRKEILTLANQQPDKDLETKLKDVQDPLALRRQVVEAQAQEREKHVVVIRDTLDASGGTPYCNEHPDLEYAVLHEAYQRAAELDPDDDALRRHASELWRELGPALYEDKIRRMFIERSASADISWGEATRIRKEMQALGVDYDSSSFRDAAYGMYADPTERSFDHFFDKLPADQQTVSAELGSGLDPVARTAAIRMLRALGVDPDHADDDDWGRIALAIVRSGPAGAAIGGGPAPELPDFDDPDDLGLDPEAIRACADLYYVHVFDRLGAFDAVDNLATRFLDRTDTDLGSAGPLVYLYVKRRSDRLSTEERRTIAKSLFEGGAGDDTSFEILMTRLVESLVGFTNAQSAFELLGGDDDKLPIAGRRLAVERSATDLQRYLSRSGGGIVRFLAREAGAQLIEAFEILECEEIRCQFRGDSDGDLFGAIERLTESAERAGSMPPADQMRILAVSGRKVMRALADDAEHPGRRRKGRRLEKLADLAFTWHAAHTWPATPQHAGREERRRTPTPAAIENGSGSIIQLRRRGGLTA